MRSKALWSEALNYCWWTISKHILDYICVQTIKFKNLVHFWKFNKLLIKDLNQKFIQLFSNFDLKYNWIVFEICFEAKSLFIDFISVFY